MGPALTDLKTWNIRRKDMIESFFIVAKTHAIFLNMLFKKHYRGWLKCCWDYRNNILVWFVRFDGKKRDGYCNTYDQESDIICQDNVEGRTTWNGLPINDSMKDRLVFEIIEFGSVRKYVFKGVYRMIDNVSDPYGKEYFRKTQSHFTIQTA